MSDRNEVGERIEMLRKSLGFGQEEFAAKLKTTITTLSQYENGWTKPGFKFLFYLTTIFNVNLNYVVRGEGEPFIPRRVDPQRVGERKPFGEFNGDVEKMLWYMEHSRLALGAIMTPAKEYLYRNEDLIEKDIKLSGPGEDEEKK